MPRGRRNASNDSLAFVVEILQGIVCLERNETLGSLLRSSKHGQLKVDQRKADRVCHSIQAINLLIIILDQRERPGIHSLDVICDWSREKVSFADDDDDEK